jgi:hypothetical protein
MKLVARISPDAAAWMWGVNGACGVLSSIVAVAISMWLGINTNFLIAGALYTLLVLPAVALARKARLHAGAVRVTPLAIAEDSVA